MISLNSIRQNAKQTANNEFGERWMFYSTRSSSCENIFTTALINIHYVHINIISCIYIYHIYFTSEYYLFATACMHLKV